MAINPQNLELICYRVNKIYFTWKTNPPKTKEVKKNKLLVCVEGIYKQIV